MFIRILRRVLLSACCLPMLSGSCLAADSQLPRCEVLHKQLEAIDARLRHAHVNQVGERLKERRRQLQEAFWRLGCKS
ncbi:MAG: hypothetical protein QM718_04355 [Steroidobacteraceae bacterium]